MIIYNQKTFKIVSPQKTTVVGSKLWYNNNQTNFALFGGYWLDWWKVGTSCCRLTSNPLETFANHGASLSCKPRVQ